MAAKKTTDRVEEKKPKPLNAEDITERFADKVKDITETYIFTDEEFRHLTVALTNAKMAIHTICDSLNLVTKDCSMLNLPVSTLTTIIPLVSLNMIKMQNFITDIDNILEHAKVSINRKRHLSPVYSMWYTFSRDEFKDYYTATFQLRKFCSMMVNIKEVL